MTATVATLLDHNWLAVLPDHWRSPDRTLDAVLRLHASAKTDILSYFESLVIKATWSKASSH